MTKRAMEVLWIFALSVAVGVASAIVTMCIGYRM